MAQVDDDIDDLLRRPIPATRLGLPAQVIGTGPTVRYSAMPEMFESLIYSVRHELNMDRRSFELNYENNILFYDPSLTADMRRRQESYIAKSRPVTLEAVEGWSWQRRLWNNAVAMFGPVL